MSEVTESAAQVGEDPRAPVISLSAVQVSKLIEDVVARLMPEFTKVNENLEQVRQNVNENLEQVRQNVDHVSRRVDQVSRQMDDLDSRVERQGMRLAAIESFPWPPMQRPPSRHATATHSATSPHRVRSGYSG